MIRFPCPACGLSLSAPDDCAGRGTTCRNCNNPILVPQLAPHWAVQPPQPKTAPTPPESPPLETPLWEDTPEPPITVKKAAPFLAFTLALALFVFAGWLMLKLSGPSPSPPESDKRSAKLAFRGREKAAVAAPLSPVSTVNNPPTRAPQRQEKTPHQVAEKAPPESKTEEPPLPQRVQPPAPRDQTSPAPQTEPFVAAKQTKKRVKTTSPPIPTNRQRAKLPRPLEGREEPGSSDDPNESKDNPPVESETLRPGGYRGTLVSTPNEGGLFRVEVEYGHVRVKRGKQEEYEKIQRRLIRLYGTAVGEQVKALTRIQLTPVSFMVSPARVRVRVSPTRFSVGMTPARVRVWDNVTLPDRSAISGAAGKAAGAVAEFDALRARLLGLLETVQDTQTVIFHAAPKVQVRVLKPPVEPAAKSKKTEAPKSTAKGKKTEAPKKGKYALPGHAGALTDLKTGQRILLKLKPSRKVYPRLVTVVIVEEEPEDDSLAK